MLKTALIETAAVRIDNYNFNDTFGQVQTVAESLIIFSMKSFIN